MEVHISSELARAVIDDVAPEELPMFEIMRDAFVQDPGKARPRGSGDEAMSFGYSDAASMITPIVLLACENIVRELAGDVVKPIAQSVAQAILRRLARLVGREPNAEPLTAAQLDKIKATIERVARSNKLSETRVKTLTDATVAALNGGAPISS